MLTGSPTIRSIPKVSPKSLNLTVFCLFCSHVCEGMQTARHATIVLIIVPLCFQVKLE